LGPNRTLLKYIVAALVHDFERFQVDPGTIAGLRNIRGANIHDLIIILCRNELLPRSRLLRCKDAVLEDLFLGSAS
jgi:hypothetical protein